MNKTITRIEPWQAGKPSALICFALGLMIAVPMLAVNLLRDLDPETKPGVWFSIILPFFYTFAGFVFTLLGCWIYNLSAKFVGGLSISVEDKGSHESAVTGDTR